MPVNPARCCDPVLNVYNGLRVSHSSPRTVALFYTCTYVTYNINKRDADMPAGDWQLLCHKENDCLSYLCFDLNSEIGVLSFFPRRVRLLITLKHTYISSRHALAPEQSIRLEGSTVFFKTKIIIRIKRYFTGIYWSIIETKSLAIKSLKSFGTLFVC